ncbi:MAG: hypothetical protein ACYCZB_15880 [Acidiphilium sp.]
MNANTQRHAASTASKFQEGALFLYLPFLDDRHLSVLAASA